MGTQGVVNEDTLTDVVRAAVVEALAVDTSEVTPDTTLFGDLGAESIDLLDILFRIERKTGIKVRSAEVGAYIRGDIAQGGFADETGFVSGRGLAQLKSVMPQIDEQELFGKLLPEDIMKLFSMQNLVALFAARASTRAT